MAQELNEEEDPNVSISTPHNNIFKTSMTDMRVARNFFEQYLPEEILPFVDLQQLKLSSSSYVDKKLRSRSSDVLYETVISGESGYLYVLIEHQSSVDPMMPFRLWRYKILIWEDFLKGKQASKNTKLPCIIPLVFYAGQDPWTASLDLKNLIKAPTDLIERVLYRPAFLIDATTLNDNQLIEQSWAGALTYFMKHIRDRDVCLCIQDLLESIKKLEQAGGFDFVTNLLHYAIRTGETEDREALVKLIQEELPPKIGEKIMTVAQQFINQGRQEGRLEGVHTGESNALETLLTAMFGELRPSYKEKIRAASSETLLAWIKQAPRAQSIEDVFSTKH